MKVTAIETLRFNQHSNLLIARVETDDGLAGLGETYFDAEVVEAYVHQVAAPLILGQDASRISWLTDRLVPYLGYQGAGAETRGISALNIALWDLLGRATGQPLYQLLGGKVRDDIAVYNTCAGSGYVQGPDGQRLDNWGLPARTPADGDYEDLHSFLTRPGELAVELIEQGFGGMKIWPFDTYAELHQGRDIGRGELSHAVGIIEQIRDAVGTQIDVMVELHGLWSLHGARRIAQALEDLDIAWLEDGIRPDRVDALARFAATTDIPVAGGETLVGASSYRHLLEVGAVDIPIVDPTWVGGVTEAVRIAQVAAEFGAPVAAHDCTGPISLAVCTHLAVSQPNALVQEIVRAFYFGWYAELVTDLPPLVDGRISAPTAPGLGLDLQPDIQQRDGVLVRRSAV